MFNKDIFMKNIAYLAKKKEIKIGELEEKIGVSKGYISRIGKKNNGVATGIDIAVKISKELGVSLEVLLLVDLKTIDDNEQYLLNLFSKLKLKTDERSIFWDKIEPQNIKEIMDGGPISDFPMLELLPGQNRERDRNGLYDDFSDLKKVYVSSFLGYGLIQSLEQYPAKPWFKCKIDQYNTFWLTYMIRKVDNDNIQEVYELYLETKEIVERDDEYGGSRYYETINTPLCCNITAADVIKNAMVSLYDTVEMHKDDIKISDTVMSALDRFINS